MSSEASLDLKGSWPWGRQSPAKRLDDLARRKEEVERRKKRLEEAYLERMVDFDRMLEALQQDEALARKCEEDRCRRRVRALTEAIQRSGGTLPKSFASRKPDQALISELELLAKGGPDLDHEVELEFSEDAAPGSSVGFEEMSGLTRKSAKPRR